MDMSFSCADGGQGSGDMYGGNGFMWRFVEGLGLFPFIIIYTLVLIISLWGMPRQRMKLMTTLFLSAGLM